MNISLGKDIKDVSEIFYHAPYSMLLFLLVIFFPTIIANWIPLFPIWMRNYVGPIVSLLIIVAAVQKRKEIILWQRKTILFNHLKKYKRRSKKYLSEEWEEKRLFTIKNISELLYKYPDVFKEVEVVSSKGKLPGLTLVTLDETTENKTIGILDQGRSTRIVGNTFKDLGIAIKEEGKDAEIVDNKITK